MPLIIENDILSNVEGIICHQVNCFHIGKGLAKDIINIYPIVKTEYDNFVNKYEHSKSLLGKTLYVPINDSLIIANLFGQYNYGNDGALYTNYRKLYECLEDVRYQAERLQKNVHIPYGIGCGYGGGEWKYILSEIERVFDGYSNNSPGISCNCYIEKKPEV